MNAKIKFTFAVLFVLSIVSLVMADAETTPKTCVAECPEKNENVCGYDSTCYTVFSNKCKYDYEKCSKKHNLETVDMSLCELAAKKSHPAYSICNQ